MPNYETGQCCGIKFDESSFNNGEYFCPDCNTAYYLNDFETAEIDPLEEQFSKECDKGDEVRMDKEFKEHFKN